MKLTCGRTDLYPGKRTAGLHLWHRGKISILFRNSECDWDLGLERRPIDWSDRRVTESSLCREGRCSSMGLAALACCRVESDTLPGESVFNVQINNPNVNCNPSVPSSFFRFGI